MNDGLKDFSQWTESTKGIYRYVVAAGCCYEIVILDHTYNTDILDAKAELFVTGDWYEHKTGRDYFGREHLITGSVNDCLETAIQDYAIEMTED